MENNVVVCPRVDVIGWMHQSSWWRFGRRLIYLHRMDVRQLGKDLLAF